MDCKEKALSNESYDFITDFPFDRLNLREMLCYTNIEELYNVVYYGGIPSEPGRGYYYYQNIPKLYGLLYEPHKSHSAQNVQSAIHRMEVQMQQTSSQMSFDPTNLIASGITQVQRPPLSLTGRGTILCVIDTGERVIIMSS